MYDNEIKELERLTRLLHTTSHVRREMEQVKAMLEADGERAVAQPPKGWDVTLTRDEADQLEECHKEELSIQLRRLRIRDQAMTREYHRIAREVLAIAEAVR